MDCGGHTDTASAPANGYATCFNSIPDRVSLSGSLQLDSTHSCTGGITVCPDTTSISLSIQPCDTCPAYGCYSVITDTTINPYATGIYGNWHTNKSYVYYGQRAESDASAQTDIRKNGVIKSYAPFWSFSGTYLQRSTDSSRWVWNSQTNLFNKKGFELENTDPLGRYNSGRYGYNNSLPIISKEEFQTIKQAKLGHNRSYTNFIKCSCLAYCEKRYLVPDQLAYNTVGQALQMLYNKLKDFEEEGRLPTPQTENLLHIFSSIDNTIKHHLQNPLTIEELIQESIQTEPE